MKKYLKLIFSNSYILSVLDKYKDDINEISHYFYDNTRYFHTDNQFIRKIKFSHLQKFKKFEDIFNILFNKEIITFINEEDLPPTSSVYCYSGGASGHSGTAGPSGISGFSGFGSGSGIAGQSGFSITLTCDTWTDYYDTS